MIAGGLPSIKTKLISFYTTNNLLYKSKVTDSNQIWKKHLLHLDVFPWLTVNRTVAWY